MGRYFHVRSPHLLCRYSSALGIVTWWCKKAQCDRVFQGLKIEIFSPNETRSQTTNKRQVPPSNQETDQIQSHFTVVEMIPEVGSTHGNSPAILAAHSNGLMSHRAVEQFHLPPFLRAMLLGMGLLVVLSVRSSEIFTRHFTASVVNERSVWEASVELKAILGEQNSWELMKERQLTQKQGDDQHPQLLEEEIGQNVLKQRLFVDAKTLSPFDIFSASWWQSRERFLAFDAINGIKSVEDDAFGPIYKAGKGIDDACVTRDLLDFCVEHLSRWWKLAGGENWRHPRAPGYQVYQWTLEKLSNYTQRRRSQPLLDDIMNTTLAIVPLGLKDGKAELEQQLWATSLAATLASLLIHSVARVVMVGHYKNDTQMARQALEQLVGGNITILSSDIDGYWETKIGDTELAFVRTDHIESELVSENIPRGALVDLQEALRGVNSVPYLGSTISDGRFRYIFLTEADQILNARLSHPFLVAMDEGGIVIPHRVQPIPHPQDLGHLQASPHILSWPSHKTVISLNASTADRCCDTGEHQDGYRRVCPGRWFFCDYGQANGTFRHLDEYSLISLTDGTGIVALAGNQHSRRCTPMVQTNSNSGGSCLA